MKVGWIRFKKSLQKRFAYSRYMDLEMRAADVIEHGIPKFVDSWRIFTEGLYGKPTWEVFTKQTAWLGYLYTTCDLIAMSADADHNGSGGISGFARVLYQLRPDLEENDLLNQSIDYVMACFNKGQVDVIAGQRAAIIDWNSWVNGSEKFPLGLSDLLFSLYGPSREI